MSSEQLTQGESATCSECGYTRPITKPVVTVFGSKVGFGPGGETDMFTETNNGIICYECMNGSLTNDDDIEAPIITVEDN